MVRCVVSTACPIAPLSFVFNSPKISRDVIKIPSGWELGTLKIHLGLILMPLKVPLNRKASISCAPVICPFSPSPLFCAPLWGWGPVNYFLDSLASWLPVQLCQQGALEGDWKAGDGENGLLCFSSGWHCSSSIG